MMNHRHNNGALTVVSVLALVVLAIGNVWAGSGSLAGSRWQLVEFRSMDDAIGAIRPDDPGKYQLTFLADGSLSMRLNCNRAFGSYLQQEGGDGYSGQLTFGPLAMTRMLCPSPSMDERIAKDIAYVRGYMIDANHLYLSLMADGGVYGWQMIGATDAYYQKRKDLADRCLAPAQGGPRNWQVSVASGRVNLREQPSPTSPVVERLAGGTQLDNLGCPETDDTWCEVQPLGGGARGYVSCRLVKPAVAASGEVPVGEDDSALRAGQGQFDASGSVPCAQDPGQPTSPCAFHVARGVGGYATVVITRPDGRSRMLFFSLGRAIGADTSQADGYPQFSIKQEGDLFLIRVGTERYEVPEAVIYDR